MRQRTGAGSIDGSSGPGIRLDARFQRGRNIDETLPICRTAGLFRDHAACRAGAQRLAAAYRSQHERVGPRRRWQRQARGDGHGASRDDAAGGGFLESREHRGWRLHAQGHVHAAEAKRPPELLRAGLRRQRPRRAQAELPVFHGGPGRHLASQASRRQHGHAGSGGTHASRRGEEARRERPAPPHPGGGWPGPLFSSGSPASAHQVSSAWRSTSWMSPAGMGGGS